MPPKSAALSPRIKRPQRVGVRGLTSVYNIADGNQPRKRNRLILTLGVDTGHNEVGLSVVSETKEVFSAVAKMRNDIAKKMDTRRMYRRQKRNKLRYRKPRFLNRAASRRKGRLAPSVQWKVDAHL